MGKRRRKYGFLILAAVAAILLGAALCLPLAALARSGGGENFPGGGGGGGGSGGGGGGDDSGLVWMLLYLFIHLPWPGKLVLIVIVIVVLIARRRKRAGASLGPVGGVSAAFQPSPMPAPILTPTVALNPAATAQELQELKARDPAFSEEAFKAMASTAFFTIQSAWSQKNMGLARSFISPTLAQRFETQLGEFRRQGRTNRMDNLAIGSMDIVETFHDGGMDYITVKINAASGDYTVDDKTGQVVSGSKEARAFTEFWTFLRSDQVKTTAGKADLVTQKCPNCGAPIQINALGKCDYCGSDVTSGAFSWVLAEITQASAWRPRVQAARPPNISPLAGDRYVLGLVQCPNCGANVQDIAGVTTERCWRCGGVVPTQR